MELETSTPRAQVEVRTKEASALSMQFRVPCVDNEIDVDELLIKIFQRCGIKESSYKYFTLCKGVDDPVIKYRTSDKITLPAKDLIFQKWCLNTEHERRMLRSDPKAAHLLFIEAKHDVESGKLITSIAQKIRLDECLDPEFLVEKQYVLLCQSLPDYQSILVEKCLVCETVKLKSFTFEENSRVNVLVSKNGFKIVSESSDYLTITWYEVAKWAYSERKQTVSYLIHPADENTENWLVLQTVQTNYLLAATFEGIREAQAEELSESLFHSSMIKQTPDGFTQWTNSLFDLPREEHTKDAKYK